MAATTPVRRSVVGAVALCLLAAARAGADAPRDLEDYVLLGIQSAKIGNLGFVDSGDVGVNNAASGTGRHAGLACGKRVFLGAAAVADQAKMGQGSSVCDLFTNGLVSLSSAVTIRCSGPTAFSPLPVITPLPPLPTFAPGATALRIDGGTTQVLAPGAYGSISVRKGGTLELTGGTYEFASLKTAKLVKILVDLPSTINIQGLLRIADQSVFGPASSALGPRQIRVNVGGPVARFGQSAHGAIDLYAPDATLSFGRSTLLEGRFVGRDNRCDKNSTFRHPQCGDTTQDPGEQCDPPASVTCPGHQTCRDDCTCPPPPMCGDGTVNDPNEECDPPGSQCTNGNQCADDCTCPRCGDGKLDVLGEECDPPGSQCTNGQTCTSSCECPVPPGCGNGVLDPNEVCDPSSGSSTCPGDLPCQDDCSCPICGDGVVNQPSEQCDGADASVCQSGHCTANCLCDPCGDGVLDQGEACEPPGSATCPGGQFCQAGCVCPTPVCGDGIVNQQSEQCDGSDDSACHGSCQPDCTCPPLRLCTLTQGAYGAPGGAANGPSGLVTLHSSILPVTVGAQGDLSLTIQDQPSLICFMPTTGTPSVLCTGGLSGCGGDMLIDACANPPILDFDASGNGSSGGQGGGTLTGQTIAAKLNVALSDLDPTPTAAGLRNFVLPTTLCTTNGVFPIPAVIADGVTTVASLLTLADQALRNPTAYNTNDPITRSDINNALDAINKGFDNCATIVPCP